MNFILRKTTSNLLFPVLLNPSSSASGVKAINYCSKYGRKYSLLTLNQLWMKNFATMIVKTPTMADSITEGVLGAWEKKIGDSVSRDEVVANIETDKITLPVNSPDSGVIVEVYAKEGDTVVVGSDLFKLDLQGDGQGGDNKPSKEEKKEIEHKEQSSTLSEKGKKKEEPSPPTKEKKSSADETKKHHSNVDYTTSSTSSSSSGSGKTKSSVGVSSSSSSQSSSKDASSSPSLAPRSENRVKMTPMRHRIAQRLKESQEVAASLTTFNEVDMSAVIALRNQYKEEILKKHNVKFGFMSAFIKASSNVLMEIPAINSRVEGNEIVTPNFVDISVAVATPKGLVTPVLRNCHAMDMIQMEKALAELGERARNGQLSMDDLNGGTFTISNGGIFGSMMGTPIINIPQSAILGMHAIKDRPVVANGQIVVRPMMYLALTYDHRIIDGREAATFLVRLKSLLEDPQRFLINL